MFFLQPSGVIILSKANNFPNPSFPKHIIILIIRKLGIIHSISRIIVIFILGFLLLTKFMQFNHYHCGLIIGGSFSELKLVFCPPSLCNKFPFELISSFILVFFGSCLGIIISFPQKIMCILPSLLTMILNILFALSQSNDGIDIPMMILLKKLPNYVRIIF